ncbi:uncharacterized protein LOC124354612 [Homalodisca vitripennis]|uniref:uncharacterized protein LOC124354612 n=1 Tax=Homalodisca vitripennis TaxID=197043 RepID=UPI001EE9C2EF|nr:uncharacterized protein LOC124354612 [Homalodisca vitripennis]
MLEFCVTTAIEYKVTCLRGNHCVIYGIFISHVVVGVLDTLSAIVKCKKSVRCFNTAYYLLNHPNPSVSRLPLATFTIIAFIALLGLRLVINQYFHAYPHPLFYYGYYFSYFVPIVSLNLVAVFALVAEKAYRQVNHDLKTMCDEKHQSLFNHNRLRYLAMKHDRITDFVDEISSCYGLDILLGMFDCFLQFVLFLYLAIWTLLVEGLFNSYHNWFIPYMSSFVEIFTIMFKIVYLCYRCQKTTYHGALTLSYLHRLSTRRDLCSKSLQQISVFVMQHHSRTIEITALKLFTLNMGLLFKASSIIVLL